MTSGAVPGRELDEIWIKAVLVGEFVEVSSLQGKGVEVFDVDEVEICRSHTEAAELRERVESLERALQRYADEDNWLWGEDDQHPEGYWSEFIDDEGHEGPELALAALSPANAHAKLETRSEEESRRRSEAMEKPEVES